VELLNFGNLLGSTGCSTAQHTLADDDQDLRISFLSSAAAKIGSRITEN
jgi:hypothetical protein